MLYRYPVSLLLYSCNQQIKYRKIWNKYEYPPSVNK